MKSRKELVGTLLRAVGVAVTTSAIASAAALPQRAALFIALGFWVGRAVEVLR